MHDKWKFLDFRITDRGEFYLNPKIFEGFQRGNSVFNYDYADFLKHTFRNSEYEGRKMEMGIQIMKELHTGRLSRDGTKRKMSLPEAMARAFDEIREYMAANSDALHVDGEAAIRDLEQYFEASNENLRVLTEGVHARHAELTAAPVASPRA